MRNSLFPGLALVLAVAACGDGATPSEPTPEAKYCVRSSIALGGAANGTLAASDCDLADILNGGSGYFESYRLGVATDTLTRIAVTSGAFNPYLLVLRLVGTDSAEVIAANGDGVGTQALINVRLFAAEDYLVIVNGFDYADVGPYSLAVTAATIDDVFCIRGSIAVGAPVNGTLASTDCDLGDSYFESYRLNPATDVTVDISMTSAQFDTYLYLLRLVGTDSVALVAFDDDSGTGTNALISAVPLSAAEDYLVIANGFDYSEIGDYTLSVTAVVSSAVLGRASAGAAPDSAALKGKSASPRRAAGWRQVSPGP